MALSLIHLSSSALPTHVFNHRKARRVTVNRQTAVASPSHVELLSSHFSAFSIFGNGNGNRLRASSRQQSATTVTETWKTNVAGLLDEEGFPYIQTLRRILMEELSSKVVMVRFDSSILIQKEVDRHTPITTNAYETIKYIYKAGAKIILTSSWNLKHCSKALSVEDVAEFLSSVLQLKVVPAKSISEFQRFKMTQDADIDILIFQNLSNYKQERANDSDFSERLASGIDIFVNDSISLAHKILASTVGVTQFCYASLAGFHLEDCLYKLKKITECSRPPYVAVIGGDNLMNKAAALRFLASICDGLVFVGMMAFQIMHALGVPLPSNLVDRGASKAAVETLQYAKHRNIPILLPKYFRCENYSNPMQSETFPAHGWKPVDIGSNSLDEIASFLSRCKKILWIGAVKFKQSDQASYGDSKLVVMLNELSQRDCDVTVVGHMACQAVMRTKRSASTFDLIENASIVWEFLKGRNLPGLVSLDRAYPFSIDWSTIYSDPTKPLAVDIGSGMATLRMELNFLGLEINEKLVTRCLHSIHQTGEKNLSCLHPILSTLLSSSASPANMNLAEDYIRKSIWMQPHLKHFIATNATSTFRSIVSTYPGSVILVSIQCPNPDFNDPEHRWRMIQRSLIEAIADLLASEGKVFLQSDVEEVALRMRKQFLEEGKGELDLLRDDDGDIALPSTGWLKENPFGVRSDWERHVIARGAPMYRLMLIKR
ncbi:hypothetical protein Cgig2_033963 [Carnegiea gigantea]|uniref:Phosphoglycerate kinase n=1 Tax=Carnegiea gigantea TaxID=171969 RepID=A0A9Q1QGS0_9CARY|nr:hypothetical protein Cgig2_033963 [Carnegiea gigantea]